MAAGRFNLTRRAVLGASVSVPISALGQSLADCPVPGGAAGLGQSLADCSVTPATPDAHMGQSQVTVPAVPAAPAASAARWTRTVAAYRRAEARVASFKAAEARLPAERRGFPACLDLEEEFGRLDSLRLAALRRLFRLPAPDVAALALKLRLAVDDQAWELSGCETCLAAMADDAHRLSANSSA